MKVSAYEANDTTVSITLEPEHPAEIALLKLLVGCDGSFSAIEPHPVTNATNGPVTIDGVKLSAVVKKSRY